MGVIKFFVTFLIIFSWIFSGWPQIWQNPLFPPKVKEAYALNKLTNPHFATDASGWTITNGTGTDTCSVQTTTAQTSFSTSTYDGTDGNPSGSFKATSGTGNAVRYKTYIRQSITAPNSGGSYNTSGTSKNSYVYGKYAYVADGAAGLQIIDISNPASSSLMSTIDPGDFSEDVNILGNYAYVAYGWDGLQIIDISNPASPTSTGAYNTPGLAYDIYVSGQYAYVADQSGGLQIINVSNPASPSLAGSLATTNAQGIHVVGKYAYVADGAAGLRVIDISNPTSPSLISTLDTPDFAIDIYVSGNYAYVADYSTGLQIIDISNPAAPTSTGAFDTSLALGVHVLDNYAYVADYWDGLQIINVSNPAAPTSTGIYNVPDGTEGVYVSGNYAYVADGAAGLQIIDISNKTSPNLNGTVKVKGRFDYKLTGTTIRASNVDGFIRVDVYDSANSTFVANLRCVQYAATDTSWTTAIFGSDVSLTGGTTYTIRTTIAYRNSGTNSVTVRVDNIIATFAPIGLSSSPPADTINAELNWATSVAGSGANGVSSTIPYKAYRDTTSTVSTFLANAATSSYTDTSATGNTVYYYAVSDVDTVSLESPLSTITSVLTRPGAPGTPTFSNVTTSTLTVSWTAPTGGAPSYNAERCSGSGCTNFSQIVTGVTTSLSYNDSGLSANTLYRYRIRGANALAAGNGVYSGIGATTTQAAASTISCSTDISSTSFGVLTSASVSTSSLNASTTMSCSGTSAGCTLYVKDAGGGGNPGLWKSVSPTKLIPSPDAAFSSTAVLAAGTEGYGIQATTTASGSGGALAINSRYNQTGNTVGGLILTDLAIASSTADVANREVIATHKATISDITLSGSYSDTITYSCVVN